MLNNIRTKKGQRLICAPCTEYHPQSLSTNSQLQRLTLAHTFNGTALGGMLAELLPAVPGVLSWRDTKPAADGNALAPASVLLALLKLLGVIC